MSELGVSFASGSERVAMRFTFEDGFVEGVPAANERRIIDSYLLPYVAKPVKPKLSSTVMLVRDVDLAAPGYRVENGCLPKDFPSGENVEVFMLRRAKTMVFAPDAVVFPGGSVDARDANPDLPWFGPSPSEWSALMGCPEEDARLAIAAAAREVFEESGVLLAGPNGNELAVRSDISEWDEARAKLSRHELSFAEFLIDNGLMLRTDLFGLVSDLQTPSDEPRRYDTYFFSALMPDGQVADGNTSEAQVADWVTPARAVAEADAGRWKLMPPTLMNLTQIAKAKDAASFVQTRRKVSKCTLHVEYLDGAGERPVLRWRATDVLRGCRSDYDSAGEYVFPQGFIKDEAPWTGGWVHSRIYCHLCDNAGPMTYTGTNTWIVLGPSPEFSAEESFGESSQFKRSCCVVDPASEEEAQKVFSWCEERNLAIGAVLTTHHHADHSAGAALLAQMANCPWLSWENGLIKDAIALEPKESRILGWLNPGSGELWPSGLPRLGVVYVPGHTFDSLAFVVEGTMCAITGDILFRQGPTVLKGADGNLEQYFKSLDKLQGLVRRAKAKMFLTGHGWPIRQCHRIIDASRTHRETRLDAIRRAIDEGVEPNPEAIVDKVYVGIDPKLRDAALQSVAFQLNYLGF